MRNVEITRLWSHVGQPILAAAGLSGGVLPRTRIPPKAASAAGEIARPSQARLPAPQATYFTSSGSTGVLLPLPAYRT